MSPQRKYYERFEVWFLDNKFIPKIKYQNQCKIKVCKDLLSLIPSHSRQIHASYEQKSMFKLYTLFKISCHPSPSFTVDTLHCKSSRRKFQISKLSGKFSMKMSQLIFDKIQLVNVGKLQPFETTLIEIYKSFFIKVPSL